MDQNEKRIKLEGFTVNNTHPDLIPSILRDVRVGDSVGIISNGVEAHVIQEDSRGDFYSGIVLEMGASPGDRSFFITLGMSHPLNKSSRNKDVPKRVFNAREIAQYRIYFSADLLERDVDRY